MHRPRIVLLLLIACASGCRQNRHLTELPEIAGAPDSVREALAAARSKPDDAAIVARLGMSLHAHHQLRSAIQVYERAAGLDPAQPDYFYYWGTALAANGQYAEAVAPLRSSLKLRESAPVRLRLADSLYAIGRTAEARREYEAIIAADSTAAAAYYGLGRCLEGEAAISPLQHAIQLFPRYGAARFALAGVYRKLGRQSEADAALKDYERDKLLAPAMPDAAMAAVDALDTSAAGLLRASLSLDQKGKLHEAAALQERALAADPKLIQAQVNLISLYARMGEPEMAEAAYRKAILLEPKNAAAHYNFGVLCAQNERFDEARAAFEAAIAIDPRNADALDNLGAIVERTGAWDRAAALYRRALSANPNLTLAHYHLGRIYANQRRYPEAISEFEKAIEPVDNQTPAFLYALGATHARAGALPKAKDILRQAHTEAIRWDQRPLAEAIERDLSKLQAH